MKVKELQILLNNCDQEGQAYFQMKSGCCDDFEDLEISWEDTGDSFRLVFKPLPGYKSCRQTNKTKKDHDDYWKDQTDIKV